jgi:hypothetical protein
VTSAGNLDGADDPTWISPVDAARRLGRGFVDLAVPHLAVAGIQADLAGATGA